MKDEALKRAWRTLTAEPSATPLGADALAGLSLGGGNDAQRDQSLAVAAESARDADLLRALHGLAADARQLEVAVAAEHRPARRRVLPSRRWLALAASIALAGVIAVAMRMTPPVAQTPSAVATDSSEVITEHGQIMVASFEESGESPRSSQVFRGDFDS